MKQIIIIPDIHGRSFWKDALPYIEDGVSTVFLGDYVDPYLSEGITPNMALYNFKEIIRVAKTHDNVHLLIGNHDCTYIDYKADICECRTDYDHLSEIHQIFKDNIDRFSLYHYIEVSGYPVLFTHAGVHAKWLDMVKQRYDRKTDDVRILLDRVMTGLILHEETALGLLRTVSYLRGGMDNAGSVVWADIREFLGEEGIGIRQIVGHTQQLRKETTDESHGWFKWVPGEPVTYGSITGIDGLITCIDNHQCYYLDDSCELYGLLGDKKII